MSPYLLKSLTPVRYLVSLLHSLPFLRSSPASQAGMRYFYIPSEMSCAHKICFDTNTSVSLCCFFHTVTPLHSHNMDTLLLPWPFLSPSTVLFILPPPLPFFNSIVTSPICRIDYSAWFLLYKCAFIETAEVISRQHFS